MSDRIYLSPPDVNGVDRQMLLDALDSGWVAPVGPDLDAFEMELAGRCGRAHGVGLASGTAALHLALLELGVRAGDDVLVSTFTFAASANAVAYIGARPVFIDSDPVTWQMSTDLVAAELDNRRAKAQPMPRAAVIVDLYGQCADYDVLLPMLENEAIALVEDAAEALGSEYRSRPAGSFGDAAVLSFNGNKIITTSGGGMLVTDSERLAARCRHLATQAREPAPHYQHNEIGFNYRLSNLLAAFGRGQLSDLDRRVQRKRELNQQYRAALGHLGGVAFLEEAPYGRSNCWLTCITVDPAVAGTSAEEIRQRLESANIESRPTWKPLHLQPSFKGAPSRVDGTSELLFRRGLCLPSGSGLSDHEFERVVDVVTSCFQ